IKILLPKSVEQGLINMMSFKEDLLHPGRKQSLFGEQADLVPPIRLMHDGPRGYAIFKQNGDECFQYYRDFCQLKPSDQVLDVGSGIGRKTIPLLKYLSSKGGYEGMDI